MIIIGEKLNGSIPAVAEAIARRDADLIRQRARMQAEAGADYLDVCASVDVSCEVDTLRWMIDLVQEVTDVPICLDSPNPDALVAAIPFCKRPGMINSVSLEGRKIDTVFPVIADTPWRCVALLCDDGGIPDSVALRLAVFEKILERAAAFGIAQDRLFIDPLVVTLSTDGASLGAFAACAREIRARSERIHITSGLSNISFGLPARKYINQAFLVLAMQAGMDSAIMDPTNAAMRGLLHATEALLGRDELCLRYIAAANHDFISPAHEREATPPERSDAPHLSAVQAAVEGGKIKEIGALVDGALAAGVAPESILNGGMIAAMTAIGERFTRGEAFVPEMLIAARTMKKGLEALKPVLSADSTGALGQVVIGTVAGDMHDIGKNLVAMMLESAGFEVFDLGVNVPAERFVAAVQEYPRVKIVALSTLLTTTMPAMQEIVRALLALESRAFKIMVGGAPVTAEFAAAIGADAYTADAASAAAAARAFVA